jgi:hypothetical protein
MSRKSIGVLIAVVLISAGLSGCLFSIPGISKGNYRIQGTVLDEEGVGVEYVAILVDAEIVAFTDAEGEWSYASAKKGAKVTAKKPGWQFGDVTATVREDNQKIYFIGMQGELQGELPEL